MRLSFQGNARSIHDRLWRMPHSSRFSLGPRVSLPWTAGLISIRRTIPLCIDHERLRVLCWERLRRGAEAKSSQADIPRSVRGPERKVQQQFPPKSPTAVPPRRLGGTVNTGSLSSEESDGALSRSEAFAGSPRLVSSPAPHSILGLQSQHRNGCQRIRRARHAVPLFANNF